MPSMPEAVALHIMHVLHYRRSTRDMRGGRGLAKEAEASELPPHPSASLNSGGLLIGARRLFNLWRWKSDAIGVVESNFGYSC